MRVIRVTAMVPKPLEIRSGLPSWIYNFEGWKMASLKATMPPSPCSGVLATSLRGNDDKHIDVWPTVPYLRRPQYRLRVDDIRVFYDVSEAAVEVLAIVDKSDADTWLARFGEPEEERSNEADSAFGSEE